MASTLPPSDAIDYTAGTGQTPTTYPSLTAKREQAQSVVETALDAYDRPAILWTGGKDSTLVVHVVLSVCEAADVAPPPVVFIDHFQHFSDVWAFVDRWSERWSLDLVVARNEDLGAYIEANDVSPGEAIPVEDLDEHNRRHVRELLGYDDPTFPFLLDTEVGNHLLKTVALNDVLATTGYDGILSGVRWDEQAARADETFFSPRHDADIAPPHDRVHPILPFTERDVWQVTWEHLVPSHVEGYPTDAGAPASAEVLPPAVSVEDLPVSRRYFEGYRSLGSSTATEPTHDRPAWRQDLEGTTERAGRAQDKEGLMERLRDLGYM